MDWRSAEGIRPGKSTSMRGKRGSHFLRRKVGSFQSVNIGTFEEWGNRKEMRAEERENLMTRVRRNWARK